MIERWRDVLARLGRTDAASSGEARVEFPGTSLEARGDVLVLGRRLLAALSRHMPLISGWRTTDTRFTHGISPNVFMSAGYRLSP
jgi:hypothetical protein